MRPTASRSEGGRLFASFWESGHVSNIGESQQTFVLRIADASANEIMVLIFKRVSPGENVKNVS